MHGKVQRGLLIVLTGEQLGKGRGVMRINRTTSKRKRRSLSVLSMVVFVIVKQDLGIESPLSSKVASSSTSEESELECINKVSISESSPPWSSLCALPVFLETSGGATPPLCCCFGVVLRRYCCSQRSRSSSWPASDRVLLRLPRRGGGRGAVLGLPVFCCLSLGGVVGVVDVVVVVVVVVDVVVVGKGGAFSAGSVRGKSAGKTSSK